MKHTSEVICEVMDPEGNTFQVKCIISMEREAMGLLLRYFPLCSNYLFGFNISTILIVGFAIP